MHRLSNEQDEYLCSLVLIGDGNVGKTCVLEQFVNGYYPTTEFQNTIGVGIKTRRVNINGKYVKINFWDTAGQERYRSVTKNFYREKDGIAIVYDITNMTSFKNVDLWVSEIKEYADEEEVDLMLIGNKCDSEEKRKVTRQEARQLANQHRMLFYETSAKDQTNVDEAFLEFIQKIDVKYPSRFKINAIQQKLKLAPKPKKRNCCK